ncbi:interferon-like [Tyto alba]|uniref:interferon-like n=1 Tax=Tyto alba TaxID=56313 RepID=UPI001C679217|nr:interferon-like [Tyto alba]XP_042660667.1 interferon-like [Tyto alba]
MPAPAAPQPRLRPAAPALLLLLPPLATALACHHLRPRHATFPWDSLQLLQAVAPSPPQPCHHPHPPAFPDTLLHTHRPQQAAHTALRILQHLFHTLSSPSTPQHWDHDARHRLLNNLQHHIHRLEQCLAGSATLDQAQGPRDLPLTISKHFSDIQHFLRTHNHSACAWDRVRLQARAWFLQVGTLIRQMTSQDAPAPHPAHLHQRSSPTQRWQPRIEQRRQQPGLGLLSTAHTSASQQPAPTGKRA